MPLHETDLARIATIRDLLVRATADLAAMQGNATDDEFLRLKSADGLLVNAETALTGILPA